MDPQIVTPTRTFTDYRDICIADLSTENYELRARLASVEADRDAYRLLAREALTALHRLTERHNRLTDTHRRLRADHQELRAHAA
jgi:hypothetical protein